MRNKGQILKEIDKNLTYESIRFNNKQISDEIIKSSIDQFFPKLLVHQKWRDLSYFTKALKDEDFYKKIRNIVNMHINLEVHLEELQQKIADKSKIEDSNSHCLEELNNKKMTRAALAKRNQLTQQELRKDQIYVRLTPKSQSCLQWMLCNRKFPRIECKLSCNQHIEYLVNYLSNKWLPGKGHNRIVLYPDVGSFLKNSLSAKQRQKILKEPLNNYFMFTDVMVGCGIGQNGILNLHYDILEKKKDSARPFSVSQTLNVPQKLQMHQKNLHGFQNHKKANNLDQVSDSNKKSSCLAQKEDKYLSYQQSNNLALKSNDQQKSLFNPSNKVQPLKNHNNNHSNHFLSNESNLLNPNRSVYHDDQSIFKSIGFFAFGNGTTNSIGFKKHDFNLLSINSNSLMDIDSVNQKKPEIKISQCLRMDENKCLEGNQIKNEQNSKQEAGDEGKKRQEIGKVIKTVKSQILQGSPKPKNFKNSISSPQKQQIKRQDNEAEKQVESAHSNKIAMDQISKQQQKSQVKKHQQKLLDLRNAISFLEEAEGFKGQAQQPQQELSQKSGLKQIKTVSIKKKTTN